MLMSAGLDAAAAGLGPWLHARPGRADEQERGNFLDPDDVVAAFGADGARYVTLREVPFDRDADVSWDSFVRRYNADLANDFGNLVNRTRDDDQPLPRRRAAGAARRGESPLAGPGPETCAALRERHGGLPAPRGAGRAVGVRGRGQPLVDAEQPWDAGQGRRRPATRRPPTRLRGVLGDLLEACRLIALAAAPFMPDAAERILSQLGNEYPYAADGNGGPRLGDAAGWGAAPISPPGSRQPYPSFLASTSETG